MELPDDEFGDEDIVREVGLTQKLPRIVYGHLPNGHRVLWSVMVTRPN